MNYLEDSGVENFGQDKKATIVILIIIVSVFLFLFWIFGVYKVNKVTNLSEVKSSALLSATSEDYIHLISKKIWLPNDNVSPRIMEITDPELLISKQDFYAGSKKGDILLIFDESKKAIIYSPSRDIIINAGSIRYKNEVEEIDINSNSNLCLRE